MLDVMIYVYNNCIWGDFWGLEKNNHLYFLNFILEIKLL